LIIPSIHTQRIEDKVILLIDVSSGMTKPYFLTAEGLNNGTYCRIGTQTVKATPEMIQELQWQSRGRAPDEMPIHHAHLDDLDEESIHKFFLKRKQEATEYSYDELLYHYNFLAKEHNRVYPTVGGIMLFGKNPQKYLSEAFVICTHFKGTVGREALATRDCTGQLFGQYEKTLAFVVSQLNRSFTIKGANPRVEELEIPEDALREVILNAIIHRNYQSPAPSKVAIYDDRIEIFSPGNFPGPLLAHQLEMGLTFIRNRVIARAFREAGYIEKLGSGFLTLFQSYRKRGLRSPMIVEGHGFVKCILPRPLPNEPKRIAVMDRHEMLMQLFYIADEIRISDVMTHLTISRSTAHRLLNELVEKGRLQRVGEGAAARYLRC
jgi:ATP-dependent DNA helicase RecG